MFTAQGQAQVFLATLYAGLAAGVAYDVLRLIRHLLGAGPIATALLDLIFWVVAALLTAMAAAYAGATGLRYYLVLGVVSGMVLWASGLRRLMLGAGRRVERLAMGNKGNNLAKTAGKGQAQGEQDKSNTT